MPLSIVLAIDTSGSTHKDLSLEKSAAHNFVHALMRPVDQLDLMDFNSDVREVVPFTNNVHRVDAGLENLSIGPATALYDAVYLASQILAPRRGRKVLVIISDGGNTVKGVDYAQALEQARRGEVMIYSIIDLPVVADAGRETGGEHALITLSQETGGKYYYADEGNLDKAFRQVSEDLRTQYLIGYYPEHRMTDSSIPHNFGNPDQALAGRRRVHPAPPHRLLLQRRPMTTAEAAEDSAAAQAAARTDPRPSCRRRSG